MRRPRTRWRPARPSEDGGFDVVVEFCCRSASCRSRSLIRFACSAFSLRRRSFSRRSRSTSGVTSALGVAAGPGDRGSGCARSVRFRVTHQRVPNHVEKYKRPELLPISSANPSSGPRPLMRSSTRSSDSANELQRHDTRRRPAGRAAARAAQASPLSRPVPDRQAGAHQLAEPEWACQIGKELNHALTRFASRWSPVQGV